MFDRLIVTETSDIKNRRNYFMVSSLVIGVLFLAAVVFSIYAADYGLGNDNFELSMVVAPPPEIVAVEPERQRQQPQPSQSEQRQETPMRQVNMPRPDEPGPVPAEISTQPNIEQARSQGEFEIGPVNTNPNGVQPGPPSTEVAEVKAPPVVIAKPEPEPQPVKPDPPKPPPVISGGVVNGEAKSLPTPIYPTLARQMNISGVVQVQVLINESGKVISANAVNGHTLLKPAAEKAAWGARFSTTYLSGDPVKVSGVIVYNFKK